MGRASGKRRTAKRSYAMSRKCPQCGAKPNAKCTNTVRNIHGEYQAPTDRTHPQRSA